MRKEMVILMFTALSGLPSPVLAVSENVPMITVRHHPEDFIKSLEDDPQAGKKIYQQFCATCHAHNATIQIGAPRIGVNSDWQPRLKKGLDGLLSVTLVGLNQMPPRGGCFECSDVLLTAAITYMLPTAKNKKPH